MLGGGGRVPEHGGAVARHLGVVREPRRVRAGPGQRLEHLAMQRDAPPRGDRLLDRQARQLVAEREAEPLRAEHAGLEALVDVGVGRVTQQHRLGGAGHHRHALEQRPHRRAQPGDPAEHGVAHGRRDASPGDASTSVTKNGLPPVRGWSALGSPRPVGASVHRHGGSARRREPARRSRARPAPPAADGRPDLVVAVGRHDADRAATPPEVPQDIERRLVGPVQVLDDEDRRLGAQLGENAPSSVVRPAAVAGSSRTSPPTASATSAMDRAGAA